MASEMAEQPSVVARLAARRPEIVERVRAVLPDPLTGVVLIARGSSDHAAIYGRYVLQTTAARPVVLAAPSLHTLYGAPIRCDGFLAIAVSQSGRTPEIVTVLERHMEGGARGIAVTNDDGSPLAMLADATIPLGAGEERAVPATKTFTSQLAVFAIVAEALGTVGWDDSDWARLPGALDNVLADRGPARRIAEGLVQAQGMISVGRGYLFSVALEAALKLKETTSLLAEGYSAADLRHGPVAVIERDFPVLAFSVDGPAERDIQDLTEWLARERSAHVYRATQRVDADLPLPADLPEPLAPIPAAVRAQQVAYELALHKNMDPDAPEGLTKVTPTT